VKDIVAEVENVLSVVTSARFGLTTLRELVVRETLRVSTQPSCEEWISDVFAVDALSENCEAATWVTSVEAGLPTASAKRSTSWTAPLEDSADQLNRTWDADVSEDFKISMPDSTHVVEVGAVEVIKRATEYVAPEPVAEVSVNVKTMLFALSRQLITVGVAPVLPKDDARAVPPVNDTRTTSPSKYPVLPGVTVMAFSV